MCLSSAAKEDILSTCHFDQNTNLYSLMAFARGQLRTYFFESVGKLPRFNHAGTITVIMSEDERMIANVKENEARVCNLLWGVQEKVTNT